MTDKYNVYFRSNTKEKLRNKQEITIEEVQELLSTALKTNNIIKLKVVKCQKS